MAKKRFVNHRFRPESLKLIETANTILDEYKQMGFKLSLRQLYYQLVARDFIENSDTSYKRIGKLVSRARNAGLIDWGMIEDRNRVTVKNTHWTSPAEIVEAAARSFRIDRWQGQENYVEVMVEKDALSGILEPVCRELDIAFTANKGYSSSSAMYQAAQRLSDAWYSSQAVSQIHIIYLGDHDPSGIDMTRDIEERLSLYSGDELRLNIHRIALNMDQVNVWKPPKNPAKKTDSRFSDYVAQYGKSSWELDAIEPKTLAELVRKAVHSLIDRNVWDKVVKQEESMRSDLFSFATSYQGAEA